MTDREKLIELLITAKDLITLSKQADFLLANGVTIPARCKNCTSYYEHREYCGFWGECRHREHYCEEGTLWMPLPEAPKEEE